MCCSLILNEMGHVTYNYVFGDKDTFRLAFALSGKLSQFNQVSHAPGGAYTSVEASPALLSLHAMHAAAFPDDSVSVSEDSDRCEFMKPALLVGMLVSSPSGELHLSSRQEWLSGTSSSRSW